MDIALCDYQQDLEPSIETVDFLLRLVVVIMVDVLLCIHWS